MRERLDQLLSRYDNGQITRRELLGMLVTLAVAATAAVGAEPAIGTARQLNHVTISVRDVQKSVEFYQGLFGIPVLTPQPPGTNLKVGTGFLGIYPAQGQATGINHLCFGLDNFDADTVLRT